MGGFAAASSFILTLVATTILASYAVVFASSCYLVVLQNTAAGNDSIDWPTDPFIERILGGMWFLGQLLLWLLPAGLLSRALGGVLLPDAPVLRITLFCVGAIWAFLPLGLLSVMGAKTGQAFSLRVFVGLLRIAPSVLLFYLVTLVLLAIVAGLIYSGLFMASALPLVVLAPFGAYVWLVHSRLLGRLALLLSKLDAPEPKAKKKSKGPRKKVAKTRPTRATTVDDPWAVPERQAEQQEDEEVIQKHAQESYGIDHKPKQEKSTRPASLDPEPDPYVMKQEPARTRAAQQEAQEQKPAIVAKEQLEREIALRTREEAKMPNWPLFTGVYSLPFYQTSLKSFFWLTLWSGVSLGLLRASIALWPIG
jgi:hypothetical protein